ncbi:MAG: PspC domain-containing protein [Candidatus Aenigmarchaeota archaeon]|nr:PspC domain-containing protein [Candidatus Aenigmarchaeota archaeon]
MKNKEKTNTEKPIKRLYRSKKDRMLCGVCGGIAEHMAVDPTIVRIIWVILTIFGLGSGLLLYIICCFIIPEEPTKRKTK